MPQRYRTSVTEKLIIGDYAWEISLIAKRGDRYGLCIEQAIACSTKFKTQFTFQVRSQACCPSIVSRSLQVKMVARVGLCKAIAKNMLGSAIA